MHIYLYNLSFILPTLYVEGYPSTYRVERIKVRLFCSFSQNIFFSFRSCINTLTTALHNQFLYLVLFLYYRQVFCIVSVTLSCLTTVSHCFTQVIFISHINPSGS